MVISPRYDRRGWMVEDDMKHGSRRRSSQDAVTYGAFRTAGHVSETRLIDVRGEITHVILALTPQQPATDGVQSMQSASSFPRRPPTLWPHASGVWRTRTPAR